MLIFGMVLRPAIMVIALALWLPANSAEIEATEGRASTSMAIAPTQAAASQSDVGHAADQKERGARREEVKGERGGTSEAQRRDEKDEPNWIVVIVVSALVGAVVEKATNGLTRAARWVRRKARPAYRRVRGQRSRSTHTTNEDWQQWVD